MAQVSLSISYIDDKIEIECYQLFNKDEKVTWSKLLKRTLEKVGTEYVILLLDDFFLESEVLQHKIHEYITWMDQDSNIATFSFTPALMPNSVSNKYTRFKKGVQKLHIGLTARQQYGAGKE